MLAGIRFNRLGMRSFLLCVQGPFRIRNESFVIPNEHIHVGMMWFLNQQNENNTGFLYHS